MNGARGFVQPWGSSLGKARLMQADAHPKAARHTSFGIIG
jgi:hypothetical protein